MLQIKNKLTMNKEERLSLIEGEFDVFEAKEILTNLYMTKINFHKVKNFSSQIRFEKDDKTAIERIPVLKQCMERYSEIIEEAKNQNKKVKISSEIIIHLIED